MRYMLLLYTSTRTEMTDEERAEALSAYVTYTQECQERGVYLGADPLDDPDTGRTVRVREGERLVTDGPYAETREWLGGYFMLDCRNLDEALELAAKCPNALRGSVEVRPIREIAGRAEGS
ncbi:MAG: YCII-related protein [Solirubrobacterales bacterium]|nr:YCII-related protein [Solirubrobacterales bacterium]